MCHWEIFDWCVCGHTHTNEWRLRSSGWVCKGQASLFQGEGYIIMDADFITEPDEQFIRDVKASADLTQINQEQRPLKEGEYQMTGTFEAFVTRVVDGETYSTVVEQRVPKSYNKKTKDKKKEYPAAVVFFFRFEALSPEIKDHAELNTDGRPGWRILADIKYFPGGTKYLNEHRDAAWADPTNEEFAMVREYITPQGDFVKQKWLYVSAGQQLKMKLRDSPKMLFRRDNPDQPGVPLVQPSTPLVLSNVKVIVYVNSMEFTETLPLPEGSPADAEAPTQKVTKLMAFPTYECKGNASVSATYDKNMCLSERQHADNDPARHQLVPIEEYQAGTRLPSSNAYFYVKRFYTTLWVEGGDPQLQGVSVVRDPALEGDFKDNFNGKDYGKCEIRFDIYQWRGKANKNERYNVKLTCAKKDADSIWTSFGITDLSAFEAIMLANPNLPMHVHAKLWETPSKNHSGNAPNMIRMNEFVATMRGYYVYGITRIVPDYKRYMESGACLKVSDKFVLEEFTHWNQTSAAGRRTVKLAPPDTDVDRIRRNPLNVLGDKGVVTALGNGQLTNPTDLASAPLYIAYAGDVTALFAGKHQFYVLISQVLSDEHTAAFTGPNAPDADQLLVDLRKVAKDANKKFYYWIFALLKDAKKANPRPRPQPMAVVKPEDAEEKTKRPRPEEEIAAHVAALTRDDGNQSPVKKQQLGGSDEDEEEGTGEGSNQ